MPRYIDAEQKITVTYYDEEYEEWSKKSKTIDDFLYENADEDIPTADVRENVHAHWVYKALEGYPNITFPVCSNCDEDAIDYVESNFCPCCGAVMDEEEPTMEEDWYKDEWRDEWDEREKDD